MLLVTAVGNDFLDFCQESQTCQTGGEVEGICQRGGLVILGIRGCEMQLPKCIYSGKYVKKHHFSNIQTTLYGIYRGDDNRSLNNYEISMVNIKVFFCCSSDIILRDPGSPSENGNGRFGGNWTPGSLSDNVTGWLSR